MDGVELMGSPAELLARGEVANVPILIGSNANEGSNFITNTSQM